MWTQDNTEGFTDAELATINAVLERIMAEGDDLEPASINDAINDAWIDGISEANLEAAARKRLGIA